MPLKQQNRTNESIQSNNDDMTDQGLIIHWLMSSIIYENNCISW